MNDWIVDVVETDIFGWTDKLHDRRVFKNEISAKEYVKTFNKTFQAMTATSWLHANKPREDINLENKHRIDRPPEKEDGN
jgi:hypothetical protein